MKEFRVIILSFESGTSFSGHIVRVEAASKGDALLDALMAFHKSGGDLNKVRKTRVTEPLPAPKSNTTVGHNAV